MKIPLLQYWALLVKYLKDQVRLFIVLAVTLFSGIGLSLVIPQITRRFVDGASSGMAIGGLVILACAFIGTALIQQIMSVGSTWTGQLVAWNATNRLRIDLADHSLKLDMGYHNRTSPGEMIQKIDQDVTSLSQFFSQLILMVGGNLLLTAGVLIMLFRENLWIGLAFSLFSIIAILSLNKLREIAVPFEIKWREAGEKLFGFIEERLAGTEDIRASGAVDYVIRGLYRHQSNIFKHWKKVQFKNWELGAVTGLVILAGFLMSFIFAYYLYDMKQIGIGTAFLIIQYMGILAWPLRQISSQIQELQGIGASVERINTLLGEKSCIHEGTGVLGPHNAYSLEFSNVCFSYNSYEQVLTDVSFALDRGKSLGILGRTGSGKSTLGRLIMRLYNTGSGAIRIDGIDVRNLKHEELRHKIAMVTQDVQLFQASVRDNITFFNPEISDDRILEALKKIELWDWFSHLPGGLDTRLETGGKSMSAGEAQLLAFTRVFLRDPGLIVLDEASSRLDPATEAKIEHALDMLLENRTAIIIAHKLHTVQRVDDILILDSGAVAEHGSRISLKENPDSRFFNLMKVGLEEVLV